MGSLTDDHAVFHGVAAVRRVPVTFVVTPVSSTVTSIVAVVMSVVAITVIGPVLHACRIVALASIASVINATA